MPISFKSLGSIVSPTAPAGYGLIAGGYTSTGTYNLPTLKAGANYKFWSNKGSATFIQDTSTTYSAEGIGGTSTAYSFSTDKTGLVLKFPVGGTLYSIGNGSDILFNGSIYLTNVGDTAYYSSNGTSWQAGGNGGLSSKSLRVGGSRFIAFQQNGVSHLYSDDGITWTGANGPGDNGQNYGLAYGNGKWMVSGYNGGGKQMFYSSNGTSWTAVANSYVYNQYTYYDIQYAGSLFFIHTDSSNYYTSTDGVTITARPYPSGANRYSSVIFFNGTYYMSSSTTGNNFLTSTDGINWTAKSTGTTLSGNTTPSFSASSTHIVANINSHLYYSTDGIVWTFISKYAYNYPRFLNGSWWTSSSSGPINLGSSPTTFQLGSGTFSIFSDAYNVLN